MTETEISPKPQDDIQAQQPGIHSSLSRVGVSGIEKVIRLDRNTEKVYFARLDCLVDLGPTQKGAHMSRFEEVANEAIREVVLGDPSLRVETLAQDIAERVRERQGALRAEVTIEARCPEYKPAPRSKILTQEIYTLFGTAVATEQGTRRLIGVSAQGMTACPCAQSLVEHNARRKLLSEGFSESQINRIIAAVPVASHNQRAIGTLHLGLPENCTVEIEPLELLAIVESSMSSEIYELMKRSDEMAVVEKAHRRPRFVEDCVREMIAGTVRHFSQLSDDVFVRAHQENRETIHQHNVVAERFGLLGEIRSELSAQGYSEYHFSMREWLDSAIKWRKPKK